MLWMLISSLCMLLSAFGLGIGVLKVSLKLCKVKNEEISPLYYLMTGFTVLTVYAQIVSLFSAVTYIFAFVALGIAVACMILNYKLTASVVRSCVKDVAWFEWLLFIVFMIFIMFLTSLYPKQYDNYLYQAQLLRYYEEYGVIKGMANINTRIGFNNSIYALMGLYTFKGIYGFSLHTVNSALCLFFGIYAIHGLCKVGKAKRYVSSGLRAAMLAYVFFNAELLNCIGTDLSAGMFGLAILVLFAEAVEKKTKDTFVYGWIAVFVLYVATIKVSMAMLAILILYPVIQMIRKKEIRRIIVFVFSGLIVVLPWLVRNVLISGWLVYPFPGLDLFDVKWKIPYETAVYELALVQGWARIQTSKVFETLELSFAEWFPQWLYAQPLRYRLLLYLNALMVVYEVGLLLWRVLYKKRGEALYYWMKISVLAGVIYWLFSAPDIRFGWSYLVAFPIICVFSSPIWKSVSEISLGKKKAGGGVFVCAMLAVCFYVFMKANCIEVLKTSVVGRIQLPAFYIYQGDFSQLSVEEYIVHGEKFYYSPDSDQTGYYGFPGTTDKPLLERMEYLGDEFADGIYLKTE